MTRKRWSWIAAPIAIAVIAISAVLIAGSASAGKGGVLDDGKDLLPQAGITLEEAIAAAQSSASGELDEVDLEYYEGKLVFNVDVGEQDVKVDAATGEVLGSQGEEPENE